MINQQKKNRLIIIGIFAMTIIPYLIAMIAVPYIKAHPQVMNNSTPVYDGKLILPPLQTRDEQHKQNDFSGFDPFSTQNLAELNGHWVLLTIMPKAQCNAICKDAIFKVKQLRLMLSRDFSRTRRAVLIFNPLTAPQALQLEAGDEKNLQPTDLLKLTANANLQKNINNLFKTLPPEGVLFLIDPFGNIMMRYDTGFDPYKVVKDLKKLLSVSQIG